MDGISHLEGGWVVAIKGKMVTDSQTGVPHQGGLYPQHQAGFHPRADFSSILWAIMADHVESWRHRFGRWIFAVSKSRSWPINMWIYFPTYFLLYNSSTVFHSWAKSSLAFRCCSAKYPLTSLAIFFCIPAVAERGRTSPVCFPFRQIARLLAGTPAFAFPE